MPPEYQDFVAEVHCADCGSDSTVKYHFYGHRCKTCKSYNTSREKLYRAPGAVVEEQDDEPEEEEEEGGGQAEQVVQHANGGGGEEGASDDDDEAEDEGEGESGEGSE